MLKRLSLLARVVVTVACAALGTWAFVEAVKAEPAVVGTIATAVGGVVAVLYQQRRVERTRLHESHRQRMTPVYEDLLDRVRQQMARAGANEDVPQEMVEFMSELQSKQLLLGASSDLIHAFIKWRHTAATGEIMAAILAWEDILRVIRKDLGHDDSKLKTGDLLRLFINDLDEHLTIA